MSSLWYGISTLHTGEINTMKVQDQCSRVEQRSNLRNQKKLNCSLLAATWYSKSRLFEAAGTSWYQDCNVSWASKSFTNEAFRRFHKGYLPNLILGIFVNLWVESNAVIIWWSITFICSFSFDQNRFKIVKTAYSGEAYPERIISHVNTWWNFSCLYHMPIFLTNSSH